MIEYDIVLDDFGTTRFYKKGTKILHREDGPAVCYNNGDELWYIDGKKHRLGGPAVTYFNNGYIFEWWVNGCRLYEENEKSLNDWWNNLNQ